MLTTAALAAPPQVPDSPKDIVLTIDRPAGWSGIDEEGDDFNIRCTFTNKSKRPVRLMLADHNNYSGAKPFPIGLKARVTDAAGQVITYSIDMGDWWTSHYYAEGTYQEVPADYVRLRPGEKAVRIVPLAVVLRDLEENWQGLKAGEYTVELRLGAVVSNRLKLRVIKSRTLAHNGTPAAPARARAALIRASIR